MHCQAALDLENYLDAMKDLSQKLPALAAIDIRLSSDWPSSDGDNCPQTAIQKISRQSLRISLDWSS